MGRLGLVRLIVRSDKAATMHDPNSIGGPR
jgi:hypothetical protein